MRSFILTTALAFLATRAIADNCTPGLNYCGRTLLDVGSHQAQIDQALSDAGQPEADGGADDLFSCIGGSNGVIGFLQYCDNGCVNGVGGNDDFCA